jgi:hypothetical protein
VNNTQISNLKKNKYQKKKKHDLYHAIERTSKKKSRKKRWRKKKKVNTGRLENRKEKENITIQSKF